MFPQNNGVRFVTIPRAAELTGYSETAIRSKTQTGEWAENREWKWMPDGRKLIDLEGYNAWCLKEGRATTRGRHKGSAAQ